MAEINYQNLEVSDTNPLSPESSPVNKTKFAMPKDPKIRLLFVLGAIILFLLILSLVVSLFRQRGPVSTVRSKTTPTTKPETSPIQTNASIPTQFMEKFNQIDKQINTSEDFLPPSFDQTIGQ